VPIISILLSCAFSASMVPAILHSHISKVSTIRSMRGNTHGNIPDWEASVSLQPSCSPRSSSFCFTVSSG